MDKNDDNDDVFNCIQKENESSEEFKFRKEIYDSVYKDTSNKKEALLYSNIWINILSLNCEYSPEIMKKINKYQPSHDIYSFQQK